MAEAKKNSVDIDGGEVKDVQHTATYRPLPDSDADFRKSKSSLTKSKEKVSSDGAEEKLLQKEAEARIVTRVDMADAKYVVGDLKNGDAKVELDANKKGQFSGLTKEELLKYADDPCWVRVRWTLFALFWLAWLGMLAGAVLIIVRAPKCAPPPARTWYENGPLVDMSDKSYDAVESTLSALQQSHAQGVFVSMCADAGHEHNAYEVLDNPNCIDQFKSLVTKAKEYGVRIIVDLTANFVPITHEWFTLSENKTGEYENYFIWANGKGFDDAGKPNLPNNWVSYENAPAWSWSESRKQFYLHQIKAGSADLNFANPAVVRHLDAVLGLYKSAGAAGVRLVYGRELLVNESLADEVPAVGAGSAGAAGHGERGYWRHRQASDQPALADLMAHWASLVATAPEPSVFTLREDGARPELRSSALRPPSAARLSFDAPPADAARAIAAELGKWPILQIYSERQAAAEVAVWSLCLPAAPLLTPDALQSGSELARVAALRSQPSLAHGAHAVTAAPAHNATGHVLVCLRWSPGHTGYAFVNNAGVAAARADLRGLVSLPATLAVYRAPKHANLTVDAGVEAASVPVPPQSTLVLSYAPAASTTE